MYRFVRLTIRVLVDKLLILRANCAVMVPLSPRKKLDKFIFL